MPQRPPWSDRRRRTLLVLALGIVLGGLGAVGLPAQYGVGAGILAALCAFLLVAAFVVFLAIPGPGTAGVLARSAPVAGSTCVVAVLLLLSTSADLRLLWSAVAVAAAGWTAYAVRETRRSDVGG
ncbi:hypothetical protein DQ244_07355 [Blastococcus sp. TBT05-19]|uniref:hypothetical protein n=1 Tax=Blastococcus sp. TBT05-19 TaxID=2250581 RepID=UPI000DE8567C|nr:hypothetical protein [Blastococcus sp. TBT05-19]RBY92115.1 hypothetical protein DQ244_07355 [Blastococcus sp. TBT05-19]